MSREPTSGPSPQPTITATGIVKRHGSTMVVDDVDIAVRPGRITVVVGPNGAGKTSLLDCLSGVDPGDAGTVRHHDHDVTGWSLDRLARDGVARTFQHSSVFSSLSVTENLLVATDPRRSSTRRVRAIAPAIVGSRRSTELANAAVIRQTLTDLELLGVADVRAGVLPSGTKRLVEIARALCTQPDTLLLDEPASGLDDGETRRLHDLLHRLSDDGIALLMVEHDLELVTRTADEVHVMASGRIIASGAASEVLARSDVRDLLVGMR
ncbi:MAG: Sulfate-transporting ATPase [Acidimicrobiales bacterium]|nr:Sulfate-transporting ATPase [Acidimicrobiales bacterium]